MRHSIIPIIVLILVVAACKLASASDDRPARQREPANNADTTTNRATETTDANGAAGQATPDKSESTAECQKVNTGKNVVIKEQTFAINFKPFEGACFVSSRDPEYEGEPVSSDFAIYKNGKKVFDFPDRYNGVTFGCWVDAVSFQDLNGDSLTDIIVVSKCSAKSAPYNENSVYRNTGNGFVTDTVANEDLADFSKVKDVAAYVKGHQSQFFK